MSAAGVAPSIAPLVGNTPLLRLNSLCEATGCEILAKAEFMSVGGSVKDRPVAQMLRDASLPRGSTVVEATAGNTGSALCQLSKAFGLKLILTCPDKTAATKKAQLRALGAEVIVCPDCKADDERHCWMVARRIASERGFHFLNQFDNESNWKAHELTTGPEIVVAAGSDAIIACCVGTGGTSAGVGAALYKANGGRRAVMSVAIRGQTFTYDHVTQKFISRDKAVTEVEGSSDLEGVGAGKLFGNLAKSEPYCINTVLCGADGDRIAATMCRYLVEHEGVFVGGSAAMNVAGAVVAARMLHGTEHAKRPIVTILCDGGERYLTKQYNDEWVTQRYKDVDDSILHPRDLSFLNAMLRVNKVDESLFFHTNAAAAQQ
jgi:cysteine synthase A